MPPLNPSPRDTAPNIFALLLAHPRSRRQPGTTAQPRAAALPDSYDHNDHENNNNNFFLSRIDPLLHARAATNVDTVPETYGRGPFGPGAGTVVGITLGSVAGFLFVLWVIYACVNLGNNNSGSAVLETGSVSGAGPAASSVVSRHSKPRVVRSSKQHKHTSRPSHSSHSHSRRRRRTTETIEIRRERAAAPPVVVVPAPDPSSDRIVVEEEHYTSRSRSRPASGSRAAAAAAAPPPPPVVPPPAPRPPPSDDDDDDDEIIVLEEHTPPRRRESRERRRKTGSRERRGSGGYSYREVSRRRSGSRY
ncbi:hypothetical protein F4778DRAFT_718702 [Xylariomycetidae sp. FL2044]|nr:hypothetical protein F4778DRAFT_718702 [Xylariomycetidae sp. FL2044]